MHGGKAALLLLKGGEQGSKDDTEPDPADEGEGEAGDEGGDDTGLKAAMASWSSAAKADDTEGMARAFKNAFTMLSNPPSADEG